MPPYCRDRVGRVFRVMRASRLVAPGRIRFSLRAQAIRLNAADPGIEVCRELEASLLLDKAMHGQAVPTPESVFEDLWQQLRLDIENHDS